MIHYLDHDADVGFEIEADGLAVVWDDAARALVGVLTDANTVCGRTTRIVQVEATDLAAALVESLAELLYRFEVDGMLFSRVEGCEVTETDDQVLVQFAARGEAFDRGRHPEGSGVKAVTYHGAVLERRGPVWYARVLLDV